MIEQLQEPIALNPVNNIQVDITSGAFKADPFPFFAQLRAEAPIYPTKVGKRRIWLVTRYDDVLALLKDDRFVKDRHSVQNQDQAASAPWMPSSIRALERNMLDTDDPDHARLRGLVHKAFTPRTVERLRERTERIATELLDEMEATLNRGVQVDLLHDFALPLPLTVIAEMLGVPAEDQRRFHRWSNRIVRGQDSTLRAALAIPGILAFMRYIGGQFDQRRSQPQDDLLTALVQAEEAGDRLNREELQAMALLLLIAGHETTVNLIASGTLALLQNPQQLERLRTDPSLMRPAVEELLRYTSPVMTATERYASEDIAWHGVTIPKGEMTLAVLAAANRDPAHFPQPDQLDVGRAPNKHLGFGHGIHFCLGAPLARLEASIALDALLRRFPDLALATDANTLQWRSGMFLRGLKTLPVRA